MSDSVIVVGESMRKKYAAYNTQVITVSNGFDDIDQHPDIKRSKKFSLVHVGLMNADRNPPFFWKVLAEIIKENKEFQGDFELRLIGKVDPTIQENIHEYKLGQYTALVDYIPHQQVIEEQLRAQILLLIVNNVPSAKGIVTGKIFEYLNSRRPVLAIAPGDGDLAAIIDDCKAGVVVDFEDELQLKKSILEYYDLFKKGKLEVNSINIEKYHKKALTKEVSELINKLTL